MREGPDRSVTNLNAGATAWDSSKQLSDQRSAVSKISITNLTAGVIYLWIFDLAAGSTASVAPVGSRRVPAGLSDTWDFYESGAYFANGLYVLVSTAAPVTPASTFTDAGSNAAIVKADFRMLT